MQEDRLITLALHPPRDGLLTMVPAGAVGDEVVFLDGDRLRCMEFSEDRSQVPNIASMPVADQPVDPAAVELASGERAVSLFEGARDEWLALMANALAGIGARSLEMGVAYAKDRHAFGVPIGSFQAVAHGLADAATAVDGGTLLAREAAWAADEDPERFTELACFACAFCAEAAREASARSLHYHGGYGFMLEFDVQLYFRQGDRLACRLRGADLCLRVWRSRSTHSRRKRSLTMDFRLGDRSDASRDEARHFLDEHLTDEVRERIHTTGVYHNREFHRARAEHGLLAPGWPKELGGQGRDPLEVLAFGEAFQNAGAPTYAVGTTLMVANIIRHVGNDSQKREILPRALSGEILIVLGFTEPESGSDVAAAQTRAVRDGDEWVINGQKMFTTNAQEADYVFLLDAHQSRRAEAQGSDHLPRAVAPAGGRDPACVHRVRRADQPDLLHQRTSRRRAAHRGGRRRLGRDDRQPHVRTIRAAGRPLGPAAPCHGSVGLVLDRRRRASAVGGPRRTGEARPGRRRDRDRGPASSPLCLDRALGGSPRCRRVDGQAVRVGGADPAGRRLRRPARPRRHPKLSTTRSRSRGDSPSTSTASPSGRRSMAARARFRGTSSHNEAWVFPDLPEGARGAVRCLVGSRRRRFAITPTPRIWPHPSSTHDLTRLGPFGEVPFGDARSGLPDLPERS